MPNPILNIPNPNFNSNIDIEKKSIDIILNETLSEEEKIQQIKTFPRQAINLKEDMQYTILHYLLYSNLLELALCLIRNKKINVNIKNTGGCIPLHQFIKNRDFQKVHFLLTPRENENFPGADLNLLDGAGNSPLYYALLNNDLQMIQYLINQGADINFINQEGLTALYLTAKNNDVSLMSFLLKNDKIKINSENNNSINPLIFIVNRIFRKIKIDIDSQILMAQLLIAYGAQTNQLDELIKSNLKTPLNKTRVLLVQKRLNYVRDYPLHWAIEYRDINLITKLLDQKDINIKGKADETPLHQAILSQCPNSDIVQLIISRKPNLDLKDFNDKTPLDLVREQMLNSPLNENIRTVCTIVTSYHYSKIKADKNSLKRKNNEKKDFESVKKTKITLDNTYSNNKFSM